MQKKATLKDFKVFLFKTIVLIFVLCISIKTSFSQEVISKPASAKKGEPTERPVAKNAEQQESNNPKKLLMQDAFAPSAGPTDIPEMNKKIAEKLTSSPIINPLPNSVNEVCTFNGGLVTGDLTYAARPSRSGVATTCTSTTACATPLAGTFFYDTYTLQNLTCLPQCVTVNYVANAGGGDVFVTAYNGTFNPASVCTNRIGDGGSSSLSSTGTPITFSFNLAANATVVLVANEAVTGVECPSYTMTVTGINCAPPPPCVSPTSSILSQAGGTTVATNLYNETFNTVVPLPAGWASQNLSSPVGTTGWFQGNTAVFPANTGVGYIGSNFNNTTGANTISNWLFAPNVLLKNGDKFTFFTRTNTGAFPDRLQVRMSTNGASVNAGTTNTGVGDFTTLLLDINPTYTTTGYPTAWTQYTLTMSGLPVAGVSGRLAFRYFVENGGPGGANSDYIGIDDAVYTTFTSNPPVTCTGSTTNLKVDINGGNSPTYNVTINAAPGGNFTVNNYVSGSNIPVTPAASTVYTLVSVIQSDNPCCVGTGNTGTVTITPLPATTQPIVISAAPNTTLCAGSPTLLTVLGVPAVPLPPGYTFAWSPAAGLSNTTQFQVGASPLVTTTYTVLATAPGGCQTTANYTLNINQLPAVTTQPASITVCSGSTATFTAVGTGAGATFQWQVSTNGGTTWTNLANGAPYAGVTTGTLTVNPTSVLLNNNRYRMVVSGTCPPSANSTAAILTVNNLPVVSLTPASPVCGGIAGVNGTQITAGSAAPPVPGTVTVSSGAISVPVADNAPAGATSNLTVSTVPANATITAMRVTFTMPHTYCGDMSFNLKAPNGQILNLDRNLGGTGNQAGPYPNTGFTNTVISSASTVSLSTANAQPITGTFKADAINGITTPGYNFADPTGFVANAASFQNLYSTPNGVWTMAMADNGAGDVGTLTSWSITFDYTTPGGAGSPLTYTWSPAIGLYNNATATTPYVAGTQQNSVYAAPAVNTAYTVTGTDGPTGCQNTAVYQVVYTPSAPIVNPAAPAMCLGDVAIPLSITSSLAPAPFTTTYSSGTISVPILDNTPTGSSSTINVPLPSTAQITNMTVAINLTHTWAGDVAISLKAPNNNVLNLDYYISGTGGSAATTGFTNTRFSSTATAAISTGTNPYTGVFKADAASATANPPGGPTGFIPNVTTWNGLYSQPDGNWILALRDAFAGDAGTLTSWSLTFDYLYGPPASGIWSPNTGLFLDAAAGTPYAGTSVNTVYAKPGSSTNYSVSVASVGFNTSQTFNNPAGITINDGAPASPYPANVTVSGLPTTGAVVRSVSVSGINHTWSDDIDMILQSPSGTNVTLMSDVGLNGLLSNVNYTFNDAASAAMSITAGNPSGSYKPTNNGASDNYPAPGPGAVTDATPALANFTGNFNGVWKLFIVDDVVGDQGTITGGFNIIFDYPLPGCTSAARPVPVTVNVPVAITTQPATAAVCTDKATSFTVVVTGTAPTYQWQVSTNSGTTWANLANGTPYSGVTTSTLTITAPPVSLSTNLYRCVVSGAAPCSTATTLQRALTVNPLPTVTINATPYQKLFPGLKTSLFSTVSPAVNPALPPSGYTWLRNGATVGGNTSSLVIDVDGLGEYTLRATDINGCTNTSNLVALTDSVSGKVFIYPNPNPGQFQVRYYSKINNTGLPRGINVYDERGKRVSALAYSISAPYSRMDVDLRNHGTGVYWIEVVDVGGNRLAIGRVVVAR